VILTLLAPAGHRTKRGGPAYDTISGLGQAERANCFPSCPSAQSRRTVLQQDQAMPTRRDSIRQARDILSGVHQACMNSNLAARWRVHAPDLAFRMVRGLFSLLCMGLFLQFLRDSHGTRFPPERMHVRGFVNARAVSERRMT